MSFPFVVLADDLTGAAEIAALGWRCGRRSIVATTAEIDPAEAELFVVDTDTRLDAAELAARRAEQAARSPTVAAANLLFKKTDSVLRGPVRAELEAIATARGLARVLLVPANPALGRVVLQGRYSVNGRPVEETAFARDPHHPMRSSDVTAMLGPDGRFTVTSLRAGTSLPMAGIAIGDAASAHDLMTWAHRVNATTLPAGAAGFFAALLNVRGWSFQPAAAPSAARGAVLVVRGTRHPAPRPPAIKNSDTPEQLPWFVPPLPELHPGRAIPEAWIGAVAEALARWGHATLSAATLANLTPDAPAQIRRFFADAVAALHARGAFTHLVVEGGATASAIVRCLNWTRLTASYEWAQGVVTLQPMAAPAVDLTIKPGSYTWPLAFWNLRLAPDVFGRGPGDGSASPGSR